MADATRLLADRRYQPRLLSQRPSVQITPQLLTYNGLGGSNGAVVAASDTGVGNPFDVVTLGTGGNAVYDNTHGAAQGCQSMLFTIGSTSANALTRWTASFVDADIIWWSCYVYFTAYPATTFGFVLGRHTGDGFNCGQWRLNATGHILLSDATITAMATSASVIPLNQAVRLEGMMIMSNGVGGYMECRIYPDDGASSAPVEVLSVGGIQTCAQTDEQTISGIRFGFTAATTANISFNMWGMQVSNITYPTPLAFARANNAEGGSSGTAVTTANAGGTGNDQFNTVNGTAIKFDNAQIAHNTLSFKSDYTTTGQNYLTWTGLPGGRMWFRIYLYYTGNPTTWGSYFMGVGNGYVRVLTNGTVCMGTGDHVSGQTVDVNTVATIPTNQWFRVEGYLDNGACELKLFKTMDSTVADETQTKTSGGVNYISTNSAQWGGRSVTTDPNGNTFWFDDIGLSNTGYLGPVAAAVGPTSATITLADTGAGADAIVVAGSLALTDSGTGADSLVANASIVLADTGAGTDAIADSASLSLTDSGTGVDSLVNAVTATLADSGVGTDVQFVSTTKTLSDSGVGADTIVDSVTVALTDAGTGADALSVTVTLTLSDSGVGADTVVNSVTVTLTSSGTGADTIVDSATVTLAESGVGTDSVSVTIQGTSTITLTDSGVGADTLAAAVATALTDPGFGSDSVVVGVTTSLSDGGAGADTVGDSASVALADPGSGADSLLATILATLTDAGVGTDSLVAVQGGITKTMADSGTGVDSLVVSVIANLNDLGEGIDGVVQYFLLQDYGAGNDTALVAVTVSLADSGQGTDTLVANQVSTINLFDAGFGTDTLVVVPDNAFTITLNDTGTGVDTLAVSPVITLADSGQGIDGIVVTVQMWLGFDDPVREGHVGFDPDQYRRDHPAAEFEPRRIVIARQTWQMTSDQFLQHLRDFHNRADPADHARDHEDGMGGSPS